MHWWDIQLLITTLIFYGKSPAIDWEFVSWFWFPQEFRFGIQDVTFARQTEIEKPILSIWKQQPKSMSEGWNMSLLVITWHIPFCQWHNALCTEHFIALKQQSAKTSGFRIHSYTPQHPPNILQLSLNHHKHGTLSSMRHASNMHRFPCHSSSQLLLSSTHFHRGKVRTPGNINTKIYAKLNTRFRRMKKNY